MMQKYFLRHWNVKQRKAFQWLWTALVIHQRCFYCHVCLEVSEV
jgi:hypothetical protein